MKDVGKLPRKELAVLVFGEEFGMSRNPAFKEGVRRERSRATPRIGCSTRASAASSRRGREPLSTTCARGNAARRDGPLGASRAKYWHPHRRAEQSRRRAHLHGAETWRTGRAQCPDLRSCRCRRDHLRVGDFMDGRGRHAVPCLQAAAKITATRSARADHDRSRRSSRRPRFTPRHAGPARI